MPLHAGTDVPGSTAAGASGGAPPWRRPKVWFLVAVLLVLAAYTQLAFGLEWRTAAGRIGPGFFPRLLGVAGLALALWALATALRSSEVEDEVVPLEDEVGDGDLGKHPRLLALMVLATAAFVATLLLLGAIVASAVFLVVMLTLLNRAHPALNVAVAIGLPLAMYLLFQTLLNAGLPAGVLPFL